MLEQSYIVVERRDERKLEDDVMLAVCLVVLLA